jgi:hypothetical protein
MIERVSRFLSRIWTAYVDENRFDPETLLSEIHLDRRPPEK